LRSDGASVKRSTPISTPRRASPEAVAHGRSHRDAAAPRLGSAMPTPCLRSSGSRRNLDRDGVISAAAPCCAGRRRDACIPGCLSLIRLKPTCGRCTATSLATRRPWCTTMPTCSGSAPPDPTRGSTARHGATSARTLTRGSRSSGVGPTTWARGLSGYHLALVRPGRPRAASGGSRMAAGGRARDGCAGRRAVPVIALGTGRPPGLQAVRGARVD
jgi:hypothetical protein